MESNDIDWKPIFDRLQERSGMDENFKRKEPRPMPDMKAKHTPGAIRAAEAIVGDFNYGDTTPGEDNWGARRKAIVADIIDRETAAPETAAERDRLLEVLRYFRHGLKGYTTMTPTQVKFALGVVLARTLSALDCPQAPYGHQDKAAIADTEPKRPPASGRKDSSWEQ